MKTHIAVKYLNALPLDKGKVKGDENEQAVASLAADIMQYGYIMSKPLFEALQTKTLRELTAIHNDLIPVLQRLKGADVSYKPMYPNFPQQVMDASHFELYMNAILHYWTFGQWRPQYDELPREFQYEHTKFIPLTVASEDEFKSIFTRLILANESLSEGDKKVVKWFVENTDVDYDLDVPYKENMCFLAGILLERGEDISDLMKSATDVLRVITYLNDGDISLAENTPFKSLPRSRRKMFCKILERVAKLEDIQRHRNKWGKLFHNLHVGEYSLKLFDMAKYVRNNKPIRTFASKVQDSINAKDVEGATALLVSRPTEFARRLDHLIRLAPQDKKKGVANAFEMVVNDIPTRVLLQLLGHLKVRKNDIEDRVVFPKGSTQNAIIVPGKVDKLPGAIVNQLRASIEEVLKMRFVDLEPLGNIWIDPDLNFCPLPTQQRSASEGLKQIARGSALPFGDKKTLRFFIYWQGQDIDLSATLHDEGYSYIDHVSYTNLKSDKIQAYHSGDITSAPRGACEFIDIDVQKALKSGARYVAMNVFVFAGPTFAEHSKVHAGWMTREHSTKNQIFDPKTVDQRIDLTAKTKTMVPVIFDLKERKAIWVDLTGWSSTSMSFAMSYFPGNNVENNRATIEQTLEAIVSKDNKVTLYELFNLHAVRGTLVDNKEEADTVFSIEDGITPYNIDVINSEFIV